MPDGPLPESVEHRIHDSLLGTAVYMIVALLVGIVFLMTTRPALDGALIAIVVSVVFGTAARLPLWRAQPGKEAGSPKRSSWRCLTSSWCSLPSPRR